MSDSPDKPATTEEPNKEAKPKTFKFDGITMTPDGLTRGDTLRCTYKDKHNKPRSVWLSKPTATL